MPLYCLRFSSVFNKRSLFASGKGTETWLGFHRFSNLTLVEYKHGPAWLKLKLMFGRFWPTETAVETKAGPHELVPRGPLLHKRQKSSSSSQNVWNQEPTRVGSRWNLVIRDHIYVSVEGLGVGWEEGWAALSKLRAFFFFMVILKINKQIY